MVILTTAANRENGDAPPFKLIFLALKHHRDSGSIFPTPNELAQETGIGRSTMRRLLQSMRDQGFIRTEPSTKEVPCQRVVLLVDSLPNDADAAL